MDCLRRFAILHFILLLASSRLFGATTNWVATTTQGSGSGANAANAMSQATFLSSATSGTSTNDRNLYIFRPGVYGSINLAVSNVFLLSEQKGRAEIDGDAASFGIRFFDGYQGNVIRGFRLRETYLTGIKVNGHYNTIIDNFIDKAGRGDPSWVTNNTGTFTGQGVEAHGWIGTVILRNRIRNNGARVNLDHGIYVAGTNLYIAANVFGSNLCWGAQIYDGSINNHNNRILRNLMYGNGGIPGSPGGGSVFYSYTNNVQSYYAGNVIWAYRDAINFQGPGSLFFTNNVLLCASGYNVFATGGGASVTSSYNVKNQNESPGTGDILTNTYTIAHLFPGAAQGRFWNGASSLMRATGLPTAIEDGLDWFGNPIDDNPDIGLTRFRVELEADDRDMNLDDADYWIPPPTRVAVNAGPIQHLVTWSTVGDNYHWEGVQVWRKANAGSYAKIADLSKTADFYADSVAPLGHGTLYTYKVVLTNYVGRGPWSREVALTCDKVSISHSTQRVPWGSSYQGVPGGIPDGYTVFCNAASSIPGTNIVAATDGSDAAPAIEAALRLAAASGSNLVVTLPAGTYTLKQAVSIGGKSGFTKANNIILRGAGTNATILQAAFTNLTGNIINFGGYSESGTERILRADLGIGGTTLTLADVSGITAGTMIKVWQDKVKVLDGAQADGSDDPVHYSNNGSSKTSASAPLVRQMFMVTGVSGNNLTVDPPSVFLFRAEDAICRNFTTYETRYSGIEDLTIRNLSGAQGTNINKIIYMSQTAYCWLRNVLTENAAFAHVYVDYSLRPEFHKSRHVGAPVFGPSAGVGYEFYGHVTGPAIKFCIWDWSFPAVECGLGVSSGYIFGSYAVNSKGGTPAFDLAHGAHNAGWLVDNTWGNGTLFGDGYFGSFERGMVHRSILTGEPADGGFRRVIDACHFVRNVGVVNSRLGWTNDSAPLEYESYVNGWTGGRKSIYRLGYPNLGNTTYSGTNTSRQATTFVALDTWVTTNMVRHLNWDSATAGVVSDANLTATTSPYSYVADFDSVFPVTDWSGSPWPAVGVDSGRTWDGANPAYTYYHATIAPPPEPAPTRVFGGGGLFVP